MAYKSPSTLALACLLSLVDQSFSPFVFTHWTHLLYM